MATITPTETRNGDAIIVKWTGVTSSTDTCVAYGPMKSKGAGRGAVVFSATFGGATAALQGSIDNSVYATIPDIVGVACSATAAKVQEFSSSVLYLNPSVTGGAGSDVDITVVLRAS